MSLELEFDGIVYDTGYGEQDGMLVIEVSPIFTNESFDAHNSAGILQRYGNDELKLTDFDLSSATLFLVDQDGGNDKDIELDESQVFKLVNKDDILDKLIEYYYKNA